MNHANDIEQVQLRSSQNKIKSKPSAIPLLLTDYVTDLQAIQQAQLKDPDDNVD